MAQRDTRGDRAGQAKRVAGSSSSGSSAKGSPSTPGAGDSLSPDLLRALAGLVHRVIKAANVDSVAGECGVDRATVYKWAKRPGRIHAGALPTLAEYDPDPEGLTRVAGAILAHVASRAVAHEADRRALLIVQEIAPGKWGR